MADKTFPLFDGLKGRLRDMLDGTHAKVVSAVALDGDNPAIGATTDAAAATDTGTYSLLAFIKRGLQNWTTFQAKMPTLGQKNGAGSVPVVLSSDGPFAANFGVTTDAAATTDTGNFGFIALFKRLLTRFSNPAVVTGNITAATAAPTTIAGLVANSFILIEGGTADAINARVNSIAGGAATATVGFYASDDDINLTDISGLPAGGAVGSGSLVKTVNAVGLWNLKGASYRKVYMVATVLGAGGVTVSATLSATGQTSRVTVIERGSGGGSKSAAPGTAAAEAVNVQGIQPVTFTATIANGASLSGAIDLSTLRPGRITVPAAWTAAALSFDVSADGATYGPLFDQYGNEVSIASGTAAVGRQIVLDPTLFLSIRYMKVRSGLNGAVVAQGAQRDIIVTGV